ncbi:MAG: O-antigen ligase family protein [Elusimicrobia bacterium]|nr:O-antigen ligase family protein [Elusimicrobiota bacterium]
MPPLTLPVVRFKEKISKAAQEFSDSSPLSRLRTYALVFVALLTLVFDPSLATPFDLIKTLLFWTGSLGLFLFWLFRARASADSVTFKYHPLHLLFAGMIVLFLPSLTNSLDLNASIFGVYPYFFQGLLCWLGFGLVFFLASQVADDFWERRLIVLAVVLSAVMCLYGFVQITGLDPTPWQTRPFGPFSTLGSPLYFGGFLALQLPLTAVFVMTRERRLAVIFGLLLWAVMTSFLLRTLARSGWVAAAAGMGTMAWYLGQGEMRRHGMRLGMLSAVTGAVLLWHLFLGPLIAREPSHIQNRAKVLFSVEESSSKARLEMWKIGLMMFLDHPWAGVGLDNIEHNFWRYRTSEHVKAAPVQATTGPIHNDILQVAATTGIFGLAGLSALVMMGAWFLWRLRQNVSPGERWAPAAWTSLLVALGVFGEFNFSVLVTSLWAVIALGCLTARDHKMRRLTVSWKWVKPAAAGLFIAFILLAFKCVKIYAADRAFARGNLLSHQKNFEGSRKALAQAVQLNPKIRQYYYSYGVIFLAKANSINTLKDQKSYYLAQSVSIFRLMCRRFPWHALAWHNLATILMQSAAANGTAIPQEARDSLIEAFHYFPEMPANLDRYGEILYKEGKKDIGRRLWERALEIDANYLPSRNFMEQFKPEEYIYFFNQDLRISSAPLGVSVAGCRLKLINARDQDAQVELEIVTQPQTLFDDLGGMRDLAELGWARLERNKFVLPANSMETVKIDITIPNWPWWRGKKFVAMIHARDLTTDYPFGSYGRIIIETKQ